MAAVAKQFGDLYQTADWKTEKHVPVIDCPDQVGSGEQFTITVTVGKEIPHPNTTEHHIRWISVYYLPEGEKFVYELAHSEFNAHGESVRGANQGPAYTNPQTTAVVKLSKPGTIYATELCNIHGLWLSSKEIRIV